jgi:2-hydroxycyclohexanecarboxyl-CoA dehydrogenase
MKGLSGKVAIVTGGGSGIGEAIVLRLAEEGCRVALFDINQQAGEAVAEAAQGEVAVFKTDITDMDSVESSVAAVESSIGPVWMLVNCAGWDAPSPFLSQGPELWTKIINLNLYGPLYMHHAVCTRMAERGEGRVINIASDAGRVGTSNEAVYSACKGGTIAFSKSMARELARKNILVNSVCPGPLILRQWRRWLAVEQMPRNGRIQWLAVCLYAGWVSLTTILVLWLFLVATMRAILPARLFQFPVV